MDPRPDAERIRAFFAVPLGDAARVAATALCAQLRAQPGGDAVRWVRTETLHVTLRFLGDIEPAQVAELAAGVGAEVGGLAPFELRLGAARLFPTARRPRVVTLTVDPEAPLAALAAAVERGVVAAGFAAETRRFRGHLTLGRLRASDAHGPDASALDAPELGDADCGDVSSPVDRVVLFRSRLAPGGAIHTPLEQASLAGPRAEVHP